MWSNSFLKSFSLNTTPGLASVSTEFVHNPCCGMRTLKSVLKSDLHFLGYILITFQYWCKCSQDCKHKLCMDFARTESGVTPLHYHIGRRKKKRPCDTWKRKDVSIKYLMPLLWYVIKSLSLTTFPFPCHTTIGVKSCSFRFFLWLVEQIYITCLRILIHSSHLKRKERDPSIRGKATDKLPFLLKAP